jgi:hypothetical protein
MVDINAKHTLPKMSVGFTNINETVTETTSLIVVIKKVFCNTSIK